MTRSGIILIGFSPFLKKSRRFNNNNNIKRCTERVILKKQKRCSKGGSNPDLMRTGQVS